MDEKKSCNRMIDYSMADGENVAVEVSPAVARSLEKEERRERTHRRDDRRFLDDGGYVEGETELLVQDLGESVFEKVERRQRRAMIDAAVAALPQRQRAYIHAYYFKGYTLQDIADMEHIDKGMVHRIIKKARGRLKRLLARSGGFGGC